MEVDRVPSLTHRVLMLQDQDDTDMIHLVTRCGKDHVGILRCCGNGGDPSAMSK